MIHIAHIEVDGSVKLRDHPGDTVRLACDRCVVSTISRASLSGRIKHFHAFRETASRRRIGFYVAQ
jgi:hypothetical protein